MAASVLSFRPSRALLFETEFYTIVRMVTTWEWTKRPPCRRSPRPSSRDVDARSPHVTTLAIVWLERSHPPPQSARSTFIAERKQTLLFATWHIYSVNLYKFVEVEQNKNIGLNHFHSVQENNIALFFLDRTCINRFYCFNVKGTRI